MPIREIADRILRDSSAADSGILVDSTNSDPIAMLYALHPKRAFLQTGTPETLTQIDRLLADPRIRTVWFLRSTHDVSPARLDDQFQAKLRSQLTETVHPYEPYTPLERYLFGRLDASQAPRYFQELLEYRR